MERNTITTASKLKIGDRFYKKGDKQRKALVLLKLEDKKYFFLPSDIFDNHLITETMKARQARPMLKDTTVVYLRSTE